MASGSQNMTTYLAKQIIGSNTAANPTGALLQSGANRADDSATGDTWIFLNTVNSATNPWGIFHSQVDNKIKIIGDGTDDFWVDMDTGDTYILGKVGIGYDPNTTNNSYYLYVNGDSYVNGLTYLNNQVGIGYDPGTSGNTYKLYVNGTGYFTDIVSFAQGLKTGSRASNGSGSGIEIGTDGGIEIFHTSTPFIDFHYQASTSDYSVRLVCDSATNLGCKGSFTATSDIHANGGYLRSTLNSNTVQIGSQNTGFCHITNSAAIPFWFNQDIQMENGKIIGGPSTAYRPFQLYLGRKSTSGSNALNASSPLIEFSNSDRSQYCQLIYDDWDSLVAPDSLTLVGNQNGIFFICKNGPIWVQGGSNAGGNVNRLTTSSGMPGNMQYNQSRRGTQIYANGIAFCDPYNGNSNSDASWIRHQETTGNSGELEIAVGDDGNETIVARQYKTDNTVNRTLTLLNANGYMLLPSYINVPTSNSENPTVSQFIVTNGSDSYYRKASTAHAMAAIRGSASGTWGISITGRANSVKDRTNDNTTYLNYGASGLAASAITWLCCWNGYEIRAISKGEMANATDSAHKWVRIGGDTMTSTLTLSGGSVNVQQGHVWAGTNGNTSGERQVGCQAGAGRLYIYAQAAATANRGLYGANNAGTSASYFYIQQDNYVRAGTRLYGAVWNDYAEFRLGQMNGLKPGQIVTENGDGTMCLASKRLQKGCKVLSDTYGFALGETNEYKLPIAVSGRVLVYCDTPIEELEPGDCLCSNATGNAIKMTREEIINYPDCIIGTISEIPTYDIWHCGDQTNENGMKEEVMVNGRIWIYVK